MSGSRPTEARTHEEHAHDRREPIKALVQAAGVSPSQAPIEAILRVDLYGTAMLLEELGKVIATGGSGVAISSQSGYRMPVFYGPDTTLC